MSDNKTPLPHPSVYASSLSPDQRGYVNSAIAQAVDELVTPLIIQTKKAIATNKVLREDIAALLSRVEALNSKVTDDTKYILTRGKIVALMKELDIK